MFSNIDLCCRIFYKHVHNFLTSGIDKNSKTKIILRKSNYNKAYQKEMESNQ